MEEERLIWRGNPSQATNFAIFVVCGLLFWLVVPIFIAFWRWLQTKMKIYEVTTERIKTTTGIFTKHTEEMELYRVKDTTLIEPFFLRLFHAGTIILTTNDQTTPRLVMDAIPNPSQLREELRKYVELCRQRRGVRIAELE